MRFLPILTILALVLTFSPAVADTNTDAHAAFAFAALNTEPPKPYPDSVPEQPNAKLLVFSASWCGPCQSLKAKLRPMPGVEIVHVDFDTDKASVDWYGVKSLPTLVVIRDGYVKATAVGSNVNVEQLVGQSAPSFSAGSCQGGNCSGASSCAAGGSCSSCTTCTAAATTQSSSACSTGQCGSAATSGYRTINARRRGFAVQVFAPAVSASSSCPTCPK